MNLVTLCIYIMLYPLQHCVHNDTILMDISKVCVGTMTQFLKVKKMAKIRYRYNQAPNLTKDTNGKLTVPRQHFFCGSFMFCICLVFAMSLCASVDMRFLVTCWERADLLALVCGV